jgi:hypothetical protein
MYVSNYLGTSSIEPMPPSAWYGFDIERGDELTVVYTQPDGTELRSTTTVEPHLRLELVGNP